MLDARLEIMRRYVDEYTNGHDLEVAREIMGPRYVFTMGGSSLELEPYLDMVGEALARFTDLSIAVDELLLGRERLAMAFRETATSPRTGVRASWRGIALYEFDDQGLLASASVEQDFWGRRIRFDGGGVDLDPGVTDPSTWLQEAGEESMALADVVAAIEQLAASPAEFDDGAGPWLVPEHVAVIEAMTAGPRFAAQLQIHGRFAPTADTPPLALSPGEPIHTTATGIGSIGVDGSVATGRFVSDRYGIWLRHK